MRLHSAFNALTAAENAVTNLEKSPSLALAEQQEMLLANYADIWGTN
ncbi:MAG TPA: hypothetical protein GXX29_12285 [Firmicutes bacterium]|nr:hypothetical protein [Bacillota bacterium]